jgi:26S proteasome regulatory subunit T5
MADSAILDEVQGLTNDQIKERCKMYENNMRQYKLELNRITHESKKVDESLKDNRAKIKQNKQLPWLVSNVVEILDI